MQVSNKLHKKLKEYTGWEKYVYCCEEQQEKKNERLGIVIKE